MPVLAIDAGTTGVTALVVGEQGDVLSRGYREFAQLFPRPGWVEHEPDDIWTATVAACREALAGTDDQPTCIGITDQRETAVVWERRTLHAAPPGDRVAGPAHHRHLRPAARRRARAAGLAADRAARWTRTSPAPSSPGWPRTSRGCGPACATAPWPSGTVDSYLIARLTGGAVHVTDPSNASRTLLFDLAKRRLVRRAVRSVRRAPRPRCPRWCRLRRRRHHRPRRVPGPEAADLGHRRRPAGGALRAGLLHPRHEQVHLRHRLVRAPQHRRRRRSARTPACSPRSRGTSATAWSTRSRARSSSPAPPCSGCATGWG